MNLGVDVFARGVTPKRYQPGIGLRPGPGSAEKYAKFDSSAIRAGLDPPRKRGPDKE